MNDEGLIAARYRLGRLIGVGGMGTVYRARDLLSARDVAIKFIAQELVADDLALRIDTGSSTATSRRPTSSSGAPTAW